MAVSCALQAIGLVLLLLLDLGSRSFPGNLYQLVDSKDLPQKILEMRIVETPLNSVRSVAHNRTWVLKKARHDFLFRTAGGTWYKAEKDGPFSGKADIHFKPIIGFGIGTIRFQARIPVDFTLEQAREIVMDHKLAYSLRGENCWKYAHARAEAILHFCIELATCDNVRSELQKELEYLTVARCRMPNEVVDVVQEYNILYCGWSVYALQDFGDV